MLLAVFQNSCPDSVPVAFYYRMSASEFVRLIREKACMNSTENHECPTLPSQLPNLVPA